MKRSHEVEGEIESNKKYKATLISEDVKTFAVKLFLEQAKKGKTRKIFVDEIRSAGYEVSLRSFDRYIMSVASSGSALKITKETGPAPLLSSEQIPIAAGFIFSQNSKNLQVHLVDFIKFVKDNFNIDMSTGSAHNYLKEMGFASRLMQNKTSGFKIDDEQLKIILWNWVVQRKKDGIFDISPSKLCSIDFVFTGHRTDRRVTYSRKGCAQPHSEKSISQYTNVIITLIWSDGKNRKNRTPPILYTYNPAFRMDNATTPKRTEKFDRLVNLMNEYEITPNRVVYIGKESGEKRVKVSESPELLRNFFGQYKVKKETVILSDQGRAYFEGGNDVLLDLGFKTHATYPPPVHQYLSPNDNRLHGSSKASWRNSGVDFSDDVSSCLLLLNHLDVDITNDSKKWFQQNMKNLSFKDLDALIGKEGLEKAKYRKNCLREFNKFMKENDNDS
jgi:hypothetical protein